MKILKEFKEFSRDFIEFFRKDFFQDTYRQELILQRSQEKFFAKYLRSKKSKKINLKTQDNSLAKILENISTNSSVSKKIN
jgi:hypothetical protein